MMCQRNPKRLIRRTANAKYNSPLLNCTDCKKRKEKETSKLFKQCKSCIVTVSQTKVGIVLQFLWKSDSGDKIYISVDLVPTFKIKLIHPMELARVINFAMINQRPEGWLDYMAKYVKADMIVSDLLEDGRSQMIGRVLLKNLFGREQLFYPPARVNT
jgi:hypothetical protein